MLSRLYRYVGPGDVALAWRDAAPGHVVRSREELDGALRALGADGTYTFVVDEFATLRIADRSSEHVACAGFRPVMAAGELTFDDGNVVEASNQSTGFCPEPSCWAALRRALEAAHITHPGALTAEFEFRRCDCGQRSIVKEHVYECFCGAPLPLTWNFSDIVVRRMLVNAWLVDTVEAASRTDEDRVRVDRHEGMVVLALADGAGGTSLGRSAAEEVVRAPERFGPDLVSSLRALDARLEGQSTGVFAHFIDGTVYGASVGDSQVWALHEEWSELTARQSRKPLLGSQQASPTLFGGQAEALVVGSDGLFNYVENPTRRVADPDAAWRLVEDARLPNGELWDDLTAIIVRRLNEE